MIIRICHTIIIAWIIFLVSLAPCAAQISVQFNPVVYGQSIEGLAYAQVMNTSTDDVQAMMTIRVRENSAGTVLVASIPSVFLRRGTNVIDRATFSRAKFQFGNNQHGRLLSGTGKFPEGEYEYCFETEITDTKVNWPNEYFEQCFVHHLLPLTPLMLISPPDEDDNCFKRPDFTWQLPAPMPADARCRLVLTELKSKQDPAAAINFNVPIINQGNIIGAHLRFPVSAPSLKEGVTYAWQVTVYTGRTILKKSEIWTYSPQCPSPEVTVNTDSYRELREDETAGYYMASKVLRFSFNNPYTSGQLNYSVSSILKPNQAITGLPGLKLLPGLNKYQLDLSENKAFKSGEEYLLKIYLPGNRELLLRFIYVNEE